MMSDAEYLPLIGDLDYEVCRGHLDRETARAVVERETGWPRTGERFEIDHAFARFVPCRHRAYDLEFVLSRPGPGAFRVTLVSSCSETTSEALDWQQERAKDWEKRDGSKEDDDA